MIYEAYQGKVIKVANVLRKILKHLVLIISVISAVVVLSASFLATKGIITKVEGISPDITYGENMTLSAKAMFSDVEYEYAAFGSDDWSLTPPTAAGKYKVRARSKAAFGMYRYSEEFTFTVAKKVLTVSTVEGNILYGEDPLVKSDLAYSDKLECSGFIYDDITKKVTNCTPDIEKIKIYSENGDDVTNCYDIVTVGADVNIQPRPLYVTVSSNSMEYNGKKLEFDGYEISSGTLASKDELIATFNSSITDVGSVSETPALKVVNGDLVDVTLHYEMQIEKGTLTVTKRPIVVQTPDASKVYDGKVLENTDIFIYYGKEEFEVSSKVEEYITTEEGTSGPNGEHTKVDESTFFEVETSPTIGIESEDIISGYGKEFISDTGENGEMIYIERDEPTRGPSANTPNYIIDMTKPGIIEGDSYVIRSNESLLKPGVAANTVLIGINNRENKDVTSNYMIFYDYGTLEVTKRPVTIETPTVHYTYNGKDIYSDKDLIKIDGMLPEHKLVYDAMCLKNVGNEENKFAKYDLCDKDGNSVIDCYKLTLKYGTLYVDPLEIEVSSPDVNVTYTGGDFKSEVEKLTVKDNKLPEGFTIKVISNSYDYVNCCTAEDTARRTWGYHSDQNAFSTIRWGIFDENGESVDSANFKITFNQGSVSIAKRSFEYKEKNHHAYYDGITRDFSKPEYMEYEESQLDGMVYAVGINFTNSQSIRNATSEIENKLEFILIDESGKDVSSNFDIKCIEEAKITIDKRPITITTESGMWIYDGDYHNNEEHKVSVSDGVDLETAIADSDMFTNKGTPSYKDFTDGEQENTLTYEITYNGEDVKDNYNITHKFGTLEIKKRKITVTAESYEGIYDGFYHQSPFIRGYNEDGEEVFLVSFLNDAYIDASYFYDACETNYGDEVIITNYEKYITPCNVESSTFTLNLESNENYEITEINYGSVEISKYKVTLTTGSATYTYDGKEHREDNYSISLPDHNTFNIISEYPSLTDVGEVTNKIEFEINHVELGDVKDSCYDITYDFGTLTVNKREMHVKSLYGGWTYDGKPHSKNEWDYDRDVYGNYSYFDLVNGDTLTFAKYTEITNVWESGKNKLEEPTIISSERGNIDVTANYEIVCVYSDIEILQQYVSASIIEKDPVIYYDGKYHCFTVDDVIVEGLIESHFASITFSDNNNQKNAGYHWVDIAEFKVLDENGNDSIGEHKINENYSINTNGANLIIEYRPITITAKSAEKTYDGKFITVYGYDIKGGFGLSGLADEQKLYVELMNNSHKNVGEYIVSVNIYRIFDENGDDVTYNYNVTLESGNIKIKQRKIKLIPTFTNKTYDGKYSPIGWEYVLDEGYNEILSEDLAGFTFVYSYTRTYSDDYSESESGKDEIILAGKYRIYLDYLFNNDEVANNYSVETYSLEAEIKQREIKIKTESGTWYYDGASHGMPDYTIVSGSLADGDIISSSLPTITYPGEKLNKMSDFYVWNGGLLSYTNDCYNVTWECGTLTVKSVKVGDVYREDNTGEKEYIYVKTDTYGDYVYSAYIGQYVFTEAHDESGFDSDTLFADAMESSGRTLTDRILSVSGITGKLYFSRGEENKYYFTNDVLDIVEAITSGSMGFYSTEEEIYRNWVYENYLQIDEYTNNYLQDMITNNPQLAGFDGYSSEIYDNIAEYVQGHLSYGEGGTGLDNSYNVVEAFFSKYSTEAVCRHFAKAATMLYRAYGIPARYVEGYLVETVNGTNPINLPGHAWVEVYIDSIGWVPVEVTAGSKNFNINGNKIDDLAGGLGGMKSEEKIPLTFKMEDYTANYDGRDYNYYYSGNITCDQQDYLNENGYSFGYDFVNDTMTGIGDEQEVYAKVYVYNQYGRDITSKFDIKTDADGTLKDTSATMKVEKWKFTIVPLHENYNYTGKPINHTGSLDWYSQNELNVLDGHGFEYETVINYYDQHKNVLDSVPQNVGNYYVTVTLKSIRKNGLDVMENFDITSEYAEFTIEGKDLSLRLNGNKVVDYIGDNVDYDKGLNYYSQNSLNTLENEGYDIKWHIEYRDAKRIDPGLYYVYPVIDSITYEGVDVTGGFNIETTGNNIEINKLPGIELQYNDIFGLVYTGEKLNVSDFAELYASYLDNFVNISSTYGLTYSLSYKLKYATFDDYIEVDGYLNMKDIDSVKNAGEYSVTPVITIYDKNGKELTEDPYIYFDYFDMVEREFSVDKAYVNTTPEYENKVFDGKKFVHSGNINVYYGNIIEWQNKGFKFEFETVYDGDRINVGDIKVSFKLKSITYKGEDVTDNFEYYGDSSYCSITPFEIQLYLSTLKRTYDGNEWTYLRGYPTTKFYREMNTLPEGYKLDSFDPNISLKEVGTITQSEMNYMSDDFTWVVNGIENNANFTVKLVSYKGRETEFTVLRRDLKITTDTKTYEFSKITDSYGNVDFSKICDNEAYTLEGYKLPDGYTMELTVKNLFIRSYEDTVGDEMLEKSEYRMVVMNLRIFDANGSLVDYLSVPADYYSQGDKDEAEFELHNFKIKFKFGIATVIHDVEAKN